MCYFAACCLALCFIQYFKFTHATQCLYSTFALHFMRIWMALCDCPFEIQMIQRRMQRRRLGYCNNFHVNCVCCDCERASGAFHFCKMWKAVFGRDFVNAQCEQNVFSFCFIGNCGMESMSFVARSAMINFSAEQKCNLKRALVRAGAHTPADCRKNNKFTLKWNRSDFIW